jgi:hypothetical protein
LQSGEVMAANPRLFAQMAQILRPYAKVAESNSPLKRS